MKMPIPQGLWHIESKHFQPPWIRVVNLPTSAMHISVSMAENTSAAYLDPHTLELPEGRVHRQQRAQQWLPFHSNMPKRAET